MTPKSLPPGGHEEYKNDVNSVPDVEDQLLIAQVLYGLFVGVGDYSPGRREHFEHILSKSTET